MKQKIKILLLFTLLQLPVQLFADYYDNSKTPYENALNGHLNQNQDKNSGHYLLMKSYADRANQLKEMKKNTNTELSNNDMYSWKNNYNTNNDNNKPVEELQTEETDDILVKLQNVKQTKVSDKRYLIVIGAENYDYTDNILYSQHTAQMFTEVAQKTLGISQKNTLELTSKNASMSRIQMEMNKLLRRVKNEDTIYFYYSGHGIPVVSEKNEPYILPIDVEPEFISEAPFFKLQNIYKTLANSKASKVVAFIDSCFSGATDGVSVIKGVAATRLKAKDVTFDTKKMVVITAGKDKQYSNMYEEKKYRLFSYFLMESMLKGRTNINDIYSDIYIKVKDESYKMGDMKLQEPTISGNKEIKL